MPIQKALLFDGKSKVINHFIHGEYELPNTFWSKLQKKYHVWQNKIYTAIKGKGRPRSSQYRQKGQIKKLVKPEATISTTSLEFVNKYISFITSILFICLIEIKMYLFILDKLSYHATTHYNWIFIV